jgi:hypothetical protein
VDFLLINVILCLSIDHGKSNEPGCGANWKKIARFETIENFISIFQNGQAFQGRIGKASLSEFPEIYDLR